MSKRSDPSALFNGLAPFVMHHGVIKVDKPKKLTFRKFAELDREAIRSDLKPSTLAECEHAAKHAEAALGKDVLLTYFDRLARGRED